MGCHGETSYSISNKIEMGGGDYYATTHNQATTNSEVVFHPTVRVLYPDTVPSTFSDVKTPAQAIIWVLREFYYGLWELVLLDVCAMVGTGKALDDGQCGEIKSVSGNHMVVVCSTDPKHYTRPVPITCGRPECPICWPTWAHREAERAAARVDGYRTAAAAYNANYIEKKTVHPFNHHVISPTREQVWELIDTSVKRAIKKYGEASYNPEDVLFFFSDVFRQWTYRHLKISHLDGAAVVPHFIRIKGDDTPAEDNKNRYRAILDSPYWRARVKWSPHAHTVSYGWAIPYEEFRVVASGAVITKIKNRTNSAENLIFYLLTHAPKVPARNCLTYWGCLNIHRLRCIKTGFSKDYELCPTCGATVVHATADDNGEITAIFIDRPSYHKRLLHTYQVVRPGVDEPPKPPLGKNERDGFVNTASVSGGWITTSCASCALSLLGMPVPDGCGRRCLHQ